MEKNQKESPQAVKSVSAAKPGTDCEKYNCQEKLLYNTYKKDEICVFFKDSPTDDDLQEVKETFTAYGFDPKDITVRKCDDCKISVVVFQAENIHTVISTEGVKAGPGTNTGTVGESYSLNFYNNIPFEKDHPIDNKDIKKPTNGTNEKKENIIIAVLDTGIDEKLIESGYIWEDKDNEQNSECYKKVSTGWNFINDSPSVYDDNIHKHGSIVSQYIINQFESSPYNSVQIMPLKTHDHEGIGDLFGIICAIHFAIAKGADIINASWGFYYYHESPIPYLQTLITETLREKGILFITAAGNKVDQEDKVARQLSVSERGVILSDDDLRDLVIHSFYPAKLSDDENGVVTVTTTDGKRTSPTQNYSNQYADLGVIADKVNQDGMRFEIPFWWSSDYISGSSFATAIATGLIGAFFEKGSYNAGVTKHDLFQFLFSPARTGAVPRLINNDIGLAAKYIKKGIYARRIG